MGEAATAKAGLIGGRPALAGEYEASLVLLIRRPGVEASFLCSGTLVSSTEVITAGHCVRGKEAAELEIVAGDRHRDVKAIQVHPEQSEGSAQHDLALLRMSEEIDDIAPSLLADPTDPVAARDVVTLVGSGQTSTTTQDRGTKSVGTNRVLRIRGDEIVIAGDGAQACFGDSGGGVFLGEGATARLVAVISRAADPQQTCRGETFAARAEITW